MALLLFSSSKTHQIVFGQIADEFSFFALKVVFTFMLVAMDCFSHFGVDISQHIETTSLYNPDLDIICMLMPIFLMIRYYRSALTCANLRCGF